MAIYIVNESYHKGYAFTIKIKIGRRGVVVRVHEGIGLIQYMTFL